MQLALEVGMTKRIRNKLRMELENFDPMLLATECMFEEDEAEFGMGGSSTFVDADNALAVLQENGENAYILGEIVVSEQGEKVRIC